MSKFRKLIKSPNRFFVDALHKRGFLPHLRYPNSGPTFFAIGFSPWKEILRAYFPEHNFHFLPKNLTEVDFYGKIIPYLKANSESRILIWGMKAPSFVLKEISRKLLPVYFVEDGFIRSVELGATKSHPLSLCFDSQAPYFRSDVETDLEGLLQKHIFEAEDPILSKACDLVEMLRQKGITKYNFTPDVDVEMIYGPKTQKRVLVIGQVNNDASLLYGGCANKNSRELIEMAASENPSAQIIYRPHPEELLKSGEGTNDDLALVVNDNISLSSALKTIDHVYTYTSLAGLDALIRGISVTTVGAPFYSNWGLTDDRIKIARRTRQLTLLELVAISYFLYPKYYHPYSQKQSDCFQIVNFIHNARTHLQRDRGKKNDFLSQENYLDWQPSLPQEKPTLYCDRESLSGIELESLGALSKRADLKLSVDSFDIPSTSSSVSLLLQDKNHVHSLALPRTFLSQRLGEASEGEDASFIDDILERLELGSLEPAEARLMAALMAENGNHASALSIARSFDFKSERLSPARLSLDGGIYHNNIFKEIMDLSGLWTSDRLKENDVQYCLRKTWRIFGVNQLSKLLFDRALQKSSSFNHETIMLLAAFTLEAGQINRALELAKRAAALQPAAWKWTRYLALSQLIYREGLSKDKWAEDDAKLYEELRQTSHRFQRLIGQYKDSFAVVGNSPVLRGTNCGAEIDSRDLVIRFNSAVRSYPHSLDCGSKLNVLVLNPDFSQTKRQDFRSLDLAVISDGDMYSSRHLWTKLQEIRGQCSIQLLDSSIDRSVVEMINASPSSGLKTLYWIYSLFGPIDKKNVFGFSLNDQKPGTASSYSKQKAVRMPIVHAWDAERSLFDKMVTG